MSSTSASGFTATVLSLGSLSLGWGGSGCGVSETAAPSAEASPPRVASDDAPPPPPPATPGAPARSRYDVGGRALQVTLVPDQPTFMVSEPIYAGLVFAAEPPGAVELEVGWMSRNGLGRPENYRLTFIDSTGRPLTVPDSGPSMGGMSWTVTVGQGRDYRARLFLPAWVDQLAPGRYVVRAETTLRARAVGQAAWQSLDVAVEAPIDVVADDAAALGRLIDSIGALAAGPESDAQGEAVRRLEAFRDARALPHWLRIAALPDYGHRFPAIRALGAWNDDRALEALVRAARTQAVELDRDGYTTEALRVESASQLRLTAAQTLSESPHPGALAALLALDRDPYPSVRLTIVHRVARLPNAEARPHLERFARDPDPLVRGEAERYLREAAQGNQP